jgi:CMP-N,N'-diacetyllegionaminic acid synthase
MRVLGVIPARGGSKGIPRKNLVDLGGAPLLWWTASAALASNLSRVVLSTDDPEIARIGRLCGLDVPFSRPAALSSDSASSIDVVIHALDSLGPNLDYDAVMMLQPTTPFKTSGDIDHAIELLASSGADSVISLVDVGGHHPARMKRIVEGRIEDPSYAEAVENQPRQELEPLAIRNGAIYLTRVATLRTHSFRGGESRALMMPAERSVNIDTQIDLLTARAILEAGLVSLPAPRPSFE